MTAQGQTFGRYQLIERLAVGGMAELYRARLSGPYGFTKTVAIKKILPRLSRDPHFRRMFLHEGQIMAALGHRNLVQVFELGEVDGELFICLELVDGCDLSRVINDRRHKSRSLDPTLVAWMGREICRGLEYIHGLKDEQGQALRVVHRDVNPKNILISREGDLKLGDFGIAKSIVRSDLTLQGSIRGKLEYLSPEQARGDEVDQTSDLYSLGLILFELSTLQRFLQGKGEGALLSLASHPTWRSIRGQHPEFPPALEEIIHRALQPEPELRFANASAFAQALTRYLDTAARSPDGSELARLLSDMSDPPAKPGGSAAASRPPEPPPAMASPPVPITETRAVPATRTVSAPAADPPAPEIDADRPGQGNRWLWGLIPAAVIVTAGALLLQIQSSKPVASPAAAAPELVSESVPEPVSAPAPGDAGVLAGAEAAPRSASPPALPPVVVVSEGRAQQSRKKTRKKPASHPNAARPEPKQVAEPPAPDSASREAQTRKVLEQDLERQRLRLRREGVRSGDSRLIDSSLQRIAGSLQAGDLDEAGRRLRELESAIDGLRVDQLFLEQKLARLHRALAARGAESQHAGRVREILRLITGNQFEKANAEMNRVFDSL